MKAQRGSWHHQLYRFVGEGGMEEVEGRRGGEELKEAW